MKWFIFLCFVFVFNSVSAAVGCVRNTDLTTIYKDKAGSKYKHNGSTATLGAGCNWIPTTNPVTPCTITGLGSSAGFLAYDAPQDCDIDSNILFLLVGALGIGGFVLRKKKIIQV